MIKKLTKTDQKPIKLKAITTSLKSKSDIIPKKPREYKMFLKILKSGKIISGILMAQILHVRPNTISEWLKTKKANKLLEEKMDLYIDKIEGSKDWRGPAFLLEKVLQSNAVNETNRQNILIINNDKEFSIKTK